jgi:hypothetical protein
MFEGLFGDWREAVSAEMRLLAVVLTAGLAAAAALAMGCAGLFVYVMERFDVLSACLTLAVVFLLVSAALLALYAALRRRATRSAALARASRRPVLADPFVVGTALQVVQALGVKRALTLLAIGGGALALFSRPSPRD